MLWSRSHPEQRNKPDFEALPLSEYNMQNLIKEDSIHDS